MEKKDVVITVKNNLKKCTELIKQLKLESEDQLFFKPDANSWSAIECIEHLNLTYSHYLPLIEEKINKASKNTIGKINNTKHKHGIFGSMMINSMTPREGEIKNKMKTFKNLIPELKSQTSIEIFERVELALKNMNTYLENSQDLDWNRIRIKSALGNIFRFKLGDCFLFLSSHDYRHLLQANNAMKSLKKDH